MRALLVGVLMLILCGCPTPPPPPPPPTVSVILTWTLSANDAELTAYNVYREAGTATAVKVGTVASHTATYDDTSVTSLTTYTYFVRSYYCSPLGDCVESADSIPATITTP